MSVIPTPGAFSNSVKAAINACDKLGVLLVANLGGSCDWETVLAARAAPTYQAEWEVYFSKSAYQIQLEDGGLLLFRRMPEEKTKLSYLFLDSPFLVSPYDEFRSNMLSDATDSAEARRLYEEYRSSAPPRQHVVPLRYDFSPELYRPGAHPASHLHIGFRNETRVALDLIAKPLGFTFMILRQFYPLAWEKTVHSSERFANLARRTREESPRLQALHLQAVDHCEMRIA